MIIGIKITFMKLNIYTKNILTNLSQKRVFDQRSPVITDREVTNDIRNLLTMLWLNKPVMVIYITDVFVFNH
ncbi:hypothetical protein DAT36_19345 [Photobacterium phosphoreum]|nr:hypothetical protein DAT36_19345 [Photobacterium phosphoreum]